MGWQWGGSHLGCLLGAPDGALSESLWRIPFWTVDTLVSPCTSLHGGWLCRTKQCFSLWLERWQLGPRALEVGASRKAAWRFTGRALTLSLDLECLVRTEDLPWGGVAALKGRGLGRGKFRRLVTVGRMGWGPG